MKHCNQQQADILIFQNGPKIGVTFQVHLELYVNNK
jgi:hypothetical protein